MDDLQEKEASDIKNIGQFCYHKRLSGYSPGNRFSLLFVVILYFHVSEKPVELKFYGHLTFGHNVILR